MQKSAVRDLLLVEPSSSFFGGGVEYYPSAFQSYGRLLTVGAAPHVLPDEDETSAVEIRKREVLLNFFELKHYGAVEDQLVQYWRTIRDTRPSVKETMPKDPTRAFVVKNVTRSHLRCLASVMQLDHC